MWWHTRVVDWYCILFREIRVCTEWIYSEESQLGITSAFCSVLCCSTLWYDDNLPTSKICTAVYCFKAVCKHRPLSTYPAVKSQMDISLSYFLSEEQFNSIYVSYNFTTERRWKLVKIVYVSVLNIKFTTDRILLYHVYMKWVQLRRKSSTSNQSIIPSTCIVQCSHTNTSTIFRYWHLICLHSCLVWLKRLPKTCV